MKLESAFTNFLEKNVNLNQTRYDTAVSAEETMRKLLKNNGVFGDKFIDLKPQGSFRQETIIKPVDDDTEFDVDLLFEMEPVDVWEPATYLKKLADEIRKLDRYKDLVDTRGKTRCVTIDYESDFHIDLVPSITLYDGQQMIMNKTTNAFEVTDGDGYAQWFESRNKITGKKNLIKVVRLIKYIRDAHGTFEVKSVLLTTLLGNLVSLADVQSRDYPDLPTAFLTLITRLDDYLQVNPTMRTVTNPMLPSENFNRHWDQEKYRVFREKIHSYAQLTKEAYAEVDEIESLKRWQKVFGDAFILPNRTLSKASSPRRLSRDPDEQFLSDLDIYEDLRYTVHIDARVTQNGCRPFMLRVGTFPLRKERGLDFIITHCNVPHPYSIKWKIKNTGQEAASLNVLRGEIVDDLGRETRHESTRYEGAHYVECYVIKSGVCVAKGYIDVPIGRF
jgi:hypothetical protein